MNGRSMAALNREVNAVPGVAACPSDCACVPAKDQAWRNRCGMLVARDTGLPRRKVSGAADCPAGNR